MRINVGPQEMNYPQALGYSPAQPQFTLPQQPQQPPPQQQPQWGAPTPFYQQGAMPGAAGIGTLGYSQGYAQPAVGFSPTYQPSQELPETGFAPQFSLAALSGGGVQPAEGAAQQEGAGGLATRTYPEDDRKGEKAKEKDTKAAADEAVKEAAKETQAEEDRKYLNAALGLGTGALGATLGALAAAERDRRPQYVSTNSQYTPVNYAPAASMLGRQGF